MGPNCENFFEIFGLAVTAQKLKWAVCVEFGIKCILEMIKAGNGPLDRP